MIELKSILPPGYSSRLDELFESLSRFCEFGTETQQADLLVNGSLIPMFTNEFLASKQLAANALRDISCRACFKPQFPRFFIFRLTNPGDVVYDPFMGRGTTLLEAALRGRKVVGCYINPLSRINWSLGCRRRV